MIELGLHLKTDLCDEWTVFLQVSFNKIRYNAASREVKRLALEVCCQCFIPNGLSFHPFYSYDNQLDSFHLQVCCLRPLCNAPGHTLAGSNEMSPELAIDCGPAYCPYCIHRVELLLGLFYICSDSLVVRSCRSRTAISIYGRAIAELPALHLRGPSYHPDKSIPCEAVS